MLLLLVVLPTLLLVLELLFVDMSWLRSIIDECFRFGTDFRFCVRKRKMDSFCKVWVSECSKANNDRNRGP